jgi:hypothetical protein
MFRYDHSKLITCVWTFDCDWSSRVCADITVYANRYIHVREQLWNSNLSAEVSRYLSKFNTWTSVENANEPAMTKSLFAGFLDFLSPATRFCVLRTHLHNGGVLCAVPAVELPKGSKKARMDPTLQSCSLAALQSCTSAHQGVYVPCKIIDRCSRTNHR